MGRPLPTPHWFISLKKYVCIESVCMHINLCMCMCVCVLYLLVNALLAFLQVKSYVLFVTHYPLLAELEQTYSQTVANFHMAYVEVESSSKSL